MSVIVMGMEMPADGTKYRVVEDQAGRKFLVEDDRFFDGVFSSAHCLRSMGDLLKILT